MNDAYSFAWARAAREAEKAIDLSRFPLVLELHLQPRSTFVEVMVRMAVVDRDAPAGNKERMWVGTSETFSHDRLEWYGRYLHDTGRVKTGPESWEMAIVEQVLIFIRSIVLHELDECTLVNGERIYDPHIPERRRHDAHP